MEEEEIEKRAVRIFVGGLGEAVTTEDLRRLFESLGTVQSIETIRTKGRSLAYLDFLSDPKSLSKLFSKYNGCVWKGGKLRLEKAKEHYLDRLKKEWEEDKILSIEPPATEISTQKEDLVKEKPNSRRILDSDAKPLNIFFPRLRTVKSIPFSGTGKHKYSFQNIKVPPLPVHFCDCEEHCSPFITKSEKLSMNTAAETGGINDEEINIMNAVMNKLFEKEKVSNTKQLGKKHDSFESPNALQSNKGEVESATDVDDDDDDDDGLIINIATKKRKAALTETQELEKILENQEWSNKSNIAEEEPIDVQRSNKNPDKVKKRKPLPKSESNSNEGVSSAPAGKSKMQTLIDELGSGEQPTEPGYDLGELGNVSWSQKSSWKELVGKGGNASFSASLILPKYDSDKDQQNSDDSCTSSSTNDETEDMESESQPEDMESDESQPEDVESDESQPEDVESDESQSEDVESDESQPEDMESDESQPEDVESDESQPEDVESDESQPEDVESDESQPEDVESDESQPEDVESDESQSEDVESDESQLEDVESDESQLEDMKSDESQPEDMKSDESQPSHAQVTEEPAEAQPTNAHVIEEHAESQPTNSPVLEEPAEAQPTTKQLMTEPAETQDKTGPKITGRGSAWMQKESWTQLVNKDNNSFSISQILPDITFLEQTAKEPILYPANSNDCKHNGADKNTISRTVNDGFNLGEIVPKNSKHSGAYDLVSAPVVEKTVETSSREGSSANVEIGETCLFMRSAASLKEWAKAKAAVSGSLKRKHSEK